MSGRSELQLLPGTKKKLGIKVPGENRFLYFGSAIFGATLVTIIALNNYQNSLNKQIGNLNDQINAIEQRRNKKDEAELKLIKDRLTVTSDLIKQHTYWTQAFDWLENMLQKDVQITGLSFDNIGELKFSAKAANFSTIARQIAVFLTDNKVKDLVVGTMSPSANGLIEFDLKLDLDIKKIILKE